MYSIFTRQNLFFLSIRLQNTEKNQCQQWQQEIHPDGVYLQTQQGGEKKTMNIKYIFQFKSWLYFFLVLLKKY